MVFKPEFAVLTSMEVEAINHYFEIESSFMPETIFYDNPANLKIRQLAVSVISTHWTGENTDAFVPYLAMNYFDRYASRNPNSDAEVPLVAICCLTIASKMRTQSFSLELFPRNRYDYSHKKIMRMELRILNGLEWRMRPVTPFCFLDHFYPTFFNIGGFKRCCINEIIVQAQGENDIVKYKPSDIAFSSFLAATLIRYPSKFPSIDKLDEQSRLYDWLAGFCLKKGIKIECAEWEKSLSSCAAMAIHHGQSEGSSSSAAATIHQGQSEGSSSSAAVVIHQGQSDSSSSSAAVVIHQGQSEGSSSSAAVVIHQGQSDGSSSSAAVAIHQGMESSGTPVPTANEMTKFFNTEETYMPVKKYYTDPFNLRARKIAVSVISELWNDWMMAEDAFVPYLAMNYFDNFVSRSEKQYFSEEVAKKLKDVNEILDDEAYRFAVACLIVALTMRGFHLNHFPKRLYKDFFSDAFDEVDNWLRQNNRLKRPVTPFCFLSFYCQTTFRKVNFRLINEIIIQAQGEDDFIEYKPSEIAFSSLLVAASIGSAVVDTGSVKLLDGPNCCHDKLQVLCLNKITATGIPKQQSEVAAAWTETESNQQKQAKLVKNKNPLRYCPKTQMNFKLLWPIVPISKFVPEGMQNSEQHQLVIARLKNARPLKCNLNGSSSSAAVVMHQGQSEGSSSSAAVAIHQGQSEGSSSSAAVAIHQGQSEKEKQIEEEEEDALELLFQRMLGRRRITIPFPEIVPAAEAAAPMRLMIFDLTWPTDDPFIDESRIPTIRHPTMQPSNSHLQNRNEDSCCNIC